MTVPGVEVVVPVQDVDKYLHEAIESVLRQSVDVGHVWVVDAGSHQPVVLPATPEVRGRCTLVRADDRLYAGAARNLGASMCRSAVIGFLDADDLWPHHRNGRLLEAMETSGADWVYGMMECFAHPSVRQALNVPDELVPAAVAGGGLIRRAAFCDLGGFHEGLAAAEFVDFAARLRRRGFREAAIGEVTLRRRVHAESTMATSPDRRLEYLRAVRTHLFSGQQARRAVGHSTDRDVDG